MADSQKRLDQIEAEIDRLTIEREQLTQELDLKIRDLEREFYTIKSEDALARTNKPRLMPGDELTIIDAFWEAKRRSGAASSFDKDDWAVGKVATIKEVFLRGNQLMATISAFGYTSIDYDLALEMRAVYMNAQKEAG